jgi:hypothetical protein
MSKTTLAGIGLLAVVIVGVLILAVLQRGNSAGVAQAVGSTQQQLAASMEVSSIELGRTFAADEIAAQKKYENQRVAVTGIVQRVSQDMLENPMISLNGANAVDDVQASFDKSFAAKTRRIRKGATVTVVCDVVGMVVGSPMLDNCSI